MGGTVPPGWGSLRGKLSYVPVRFLSPSPLGARGGPWNPQFGILLKLAKSRTRTAMSSHRREVPGVYAALYDVDTRRRFSADWRQEHSRQTKAMSKALSFMLTPCVHIILRFLDGSDAGHESTYSLWSLKQLPAVPVTVALRVARCLDNRYYIRRVLRKAIMTYYWNIYVGRPTDFRGSVAHWLRVCQEVADYLGYHSRVSRSTLPVKILDRAWQSLDVLTDERAAAFWYQQRRHPRQDFLSDCSFQ